MAQAMKKKETGEEKAVETMKEILKKIETYTPKTRITLYNLMKEYLDQKSGMKVTPYLSQAKKPRSPDEETRDAQILRDPSNREQYERQYTENEKQQNARQPKTGSQKEASKKPSGKTPDYMPPYEFPKQIKPPSYPAGSAYEGKVNMPKFNFMNAPKRVVNYEVDVGPRRYSVALPMELKAGAEGKRQLHEALLHNQLIGPNNEALADVKLIRGPEKDFNSGSPNQRLDMFRDNLLAKTYIDGKYADTKDVTLTAVDKKKG